ncbi:MAG: inositol monophosphatase [Roseobacter sp.]
MKDRNQSAADFARIGGALALDYFKRLDSLTIEDKGPQDFVTEADRDVERHIRAQITKAFPEDGIVGEEDEDKPSQSGFTWVIDPIDGTANFVAGIPVWTVVIAVVHQDQTEVGVIFDPIHDEIYQAQRGMGATLNGRTLSCGPELSITRGAVGVGFSRRTPQEQTIRVVSEIMARGGVFYRVASGAISLAYVSAGRLVGYIEGHMNAWDCLAGQLLVKEAGGCIEFQSADEMLVEGGRVIVGSSGVFPDLEEIAALAYTDATV